MSRQLHAPAGFQPERKPRKYPMGRIRPKNQEALGGVARRKPPTQ